MSGIVWTQEELDAIKAALAQGAKRYTVGGVTKEFQSFDDMRALLAIMNQQISGAPSHRLLTSRKGLG